MTINTSPLDKLFGMRVQVDGKGLEVASVQITQGIERRFLVVLTEQTLSLDYQALLGLHHWRILALHEATEYPLLDATCETHPVWANAIMGVERDGDFVYRV